MKSARCWRRPVPTPTPARPRRGSGGGRAGRSAGAGAGVVGASLRCSVAAPARSHADARHRGVATSHPVRTQASTDLPHAPRAIAPGRPDLRARLRALPRETATNGTAVTTAAGRLHRLVQDSAHHHRVATLTRTHRDAL